MDAPYAFFGREAFHAAIASRLSDAGFRRVDDCAAARFALTFCTSQTELEDLYFGDGGFIQSMDAGSVLIDFSSTTPNFARELGAVAMVSDLTMVEAPIIVNSITEPHMFERDNLACFAAGEDNAVAKARKILDAIFSTVHELEGLGSAQLAHAGFMMQIAAQAIAFIEANALYKAVHRSPINGGIGIENVGAISPLANDIREAIMQKRFDSAYTIEMLMADLTAALMAADDADIILPQAEAALHLLELLAIIGGSDKSLAALSLVYDEESEVAEYGLDWKRAEQAYAAGYTGGFFEPDDSGFDGDPHTSKQNDDEFDFGFDDEDFDNGFDGYSYGSGFGYSSN